MKLCDNVLSMIKERSDAEFTREMMDEIDWNALEKEVSKRIGTSISLKTEFASHRSGNYVKFSSSNIAKKAGVMSAVLKSLVIDDFGGGLSGSGDSYWAPVHLSWEFQSMGSNGTKLVNAHWEFKKKKWAFIKV